MSTVSSGDTAVFLAAAAFNEAGIVVLKPYREDISFDLALWHENKLYRLQVKRAQRTSNAAFMIPFCKYTSHKKGVKTYKYTSQHADYIVGVVVDTGDFYCIPMHVVDKFKSGAWVNPCGRSKYGRKDRFDFEQHRNCIDLNGVVFKWLHGRMVMPLLGEQCAGKTGGGSSPPAAAICQVIG